MRHSNPEADFWISQFYVQIISYLKKIPGELSVEGVDLPEVEPFWLKFSLQVPKFSMIDLKDKIRPNLKKCFFMSSEKFKVSNTSLWL